MWKLLQKWLSFTLLILSLCDFASTHACIFCQITVIQHPSSLAFWILRCQYDSSFLAVRETSSSNLKTTGEFDNKCELCRNILFVQMAMMFPWWMHHPVTDSLPHGTGAPSLLLAKKGTQKRRTRSPRKTLRKMEVYEGIEAIWRKSPESYQAKRAVANVDIAPKWFKSGLVIALIRDSWIKSVTIHHDISHCCWSPHMHIKLERQGRHATCVTTWSIWHYQVTTMF